METLLVSAGVVALAEIGDKTQLLALLLATRYRKPIPIVLGILVATLANHAGASAIGSWLVSFVGAALLPERITRIVAPTAAATTTNTASPMTIARHGLRFGYGIGGGRVPGYIDDGGSPTGPAPKWGG